ncbi:MAG: hypothetical protein P4M15_03610, partial [Alphaproteobacteria bacterium]|nr:hypothetical protein [Alphaproteobacteria bacterium]
AQGFDLALFFVVTLTSVNADDVGCDPARWRAPIFFARGNTRHKSGAREGHLSAETMTSAGLKNERK